MDFYDFVYAHFFLMCHFRCDTFLDTFLDVSLCIVTSLWLLFNGLIQ